MEKPEQRKYTRAEIEELAKKDRSELTNKERSLVALLPTMNRKGETGEKHRGGAKKGYRRWDYFFRELMMNESFLAKMGLNIPKTWDDEIEPYPASVLAAGMITVAARDVLNSVNTGKQINKDTLQLLDRISKFGYGDKVVHEISEESFFDRTDFHFEVVPDRTDS